MYVAIDYDTIELDGHHWQHATCARRVDQTAQVCSTQVLPRLNTK